MALLVTLMVIVGLSLLGMAFVAVSETESTISVNEKNYQQTHAIAEAGARVAVEWFQDPTWAAAAHVRLMPPNENGIKTERTITAPLAYVGRYKTAKVLFDKPYKPDTNDRFYGDEDHADIIINASTLAATSDANYLARLNTTLFSSSQKKVTRSIIASRVSRNATTS